MTAPARGPGGRAPGRTSARAGDRGPGWRECRGMRRRAWSAVLLLAAGAAAPGAPARAEVPVLVELFTSEGCSSCPPADATLARVLARPPEGVRVIALGEHVDYWDALGWKDRAAAPAHARRQEAYVRRFGLAGAYTPQLVANGRVQLPGGDERRVRAAIAAAAGHGGREARVRAIGGDATHLRLEVRAEWDAPGPADVWVALVQDRARTLVARGENAGRLLEHVALVRGIVPVGRATATFRGAVAVPRTERVDRAVVVVQDPDGGPVRAIGVAELR